MHLFYPDSVRKIRTNIEKIKRTHFELRGIDSILGVSGNTFRAIRTEKEKPSIIYINWIKEIRENDILYKKIQKINSRKGFQKYHTELCESLNRFWRKVEGTDISFSHNRKLVDLLILNLARVNHPKYKKMHEKCQKFGNVPLDKYTLEKVKEYFYGIVISKSPSMGDITDKRTYDFIQDQIYGLMKIPVMLFDGYAEREKYNQKQKKSNK
jgi:hypothetical protein